MRVRARVIGLLCAAGLFALACVTSRSDAVEIIGHRGASHDAPENTLASIRLAWKQNADASETDVHLTKDGQIVVFHDFNTRRVAGRNRKVADQTLAELKQLDVGSWKGKAWAGEQIPTLAEYLAAIPEGKRLFIEIKCGPEIIPRLVQVIRGAHTKPQQICLIGFSYEVMQAAKRQLPDLKCYWIVQLRKNRETGRWNPQLASLIRKAKEAGLDGIDFGDSPALDREFVGKVKQSGLGVYTWTVDVVDEAKRLQEAGVDGITTNRPGYMKESLVGHP
ncbi:MAG TPA: glycerophosphodiester phosphodiesterase [Planctomycetaceae bacterium]|nr:glycerophosphodiester phosphodiesterase [Planctomycetaceae bacterium]